MAAFMVMQPSRFAIIFKILVTAASASVMISFFLQNKLKQFGLQVHKSQVTVTKDHIGKTKINNEL